MAPAGGCAGTNIWASRTWPAGVHRRNLGIEQPFATLKTLPRKAAERTAEATWQRIGQLLDSFNLQECANHIKEADMLQPNAIMPCPQAPSDRRWVQ